MDKNIARNCETCNNFNFNLEEIMELQWEEHHLDFSKSLLNPKYQFQAVYKYKNNSYLKLKRICLPNDWFLYGDDIIDITINSDQCPYCRCSFHNKLVIDLKKVITPCSEDLFYLIVNTQITMKYNSKVFEDMLMYFNEDNLQERDLNVNLENLKKYYLTKNNIIFSEYTYDFGTSPEPFKKIRNIDFWITIPKICKFKENNFYTEKGYEIVYKRYYLDLLKKLKKRKFKKIISKENYSKLKDKKSFEREIRDDPDVDFTEFKRGKEKRYLKKAIFQKIEKNSQSYHYNHENLEDFLVWDGKIVFTRTMKTRVIFPLLVACIFIFFSCDYLRFNFFNNSLINYTQLVGYFNTWNLLILSLNACIWLLLALTWETNKYLKFFSSRIYILYFFVLFILIALPFVIVIYFPFPS